MAEFYIGIDGGGTKTRVRLWFPDSGRSIDLEGGPSNLCSSGADAVQNVFSNLFSRIRQMAGDLALCKGVGVGAAGVGSSLARTQLTDCLKGILPSGVPIVLASDARAALYGALEELAGMIVIAGTGSVCLGKDSEGREYQAGGCGHLIDDEGSGYAIGRDICAAVVRAMDGRGEKTCLTELLAGELRLSTSADIVAYVYGSSNPKHSLAAVAPLLIRGCDADDPVSRQIAEKAAAGLLALAGAVAATLKLERGLLALHGGVLRNMKPVSDILIRNVKRELPGLTLTEARRDALDGALYLIRNKGQHG